VSPSPLKERGKDIKKRGFAPLKLPILLQDNGNSLAPHTLPKMAEYL